MYSAHKAGLTAIVKRRARPSSMTCSSRPPGFQHVEISMLVSRTTRITPLLSSLS